MSNPNPPSTSPPLARIWPWVGIAALACYGFFLTQHTAVVAGGSDSSGYLNSARLLAAGELLTDLRTPPEFGPRGSADPMHFLPQGFFPSEDRARLTPTYPTGMPLHVALAAKLFGWKIGPSLVVLGAALGAVWLCYRVARELEVDRRFAFAGAAMLAAFPVFIFTSIQPLSDTLATAWTLASLLAALRARRRLAWAAVAGAFFAVAVLVRPTNLFLAPALLVLIGFDLRRLGLFILGGIPGAAWLAFYNHHLYGGALRSGYGDILAAFAWSYGPETSVHFAKWLALLLPAVVLGLPLVALRSPERRRELLALMLAFAAITGLYVFYEVSHEVWWCLRFILPAVPALILASLLGLEALARHRAFQGVRHFRSLTATVLVAWSIGNAWYWAPRLDVFEMKRYEQAYADGSSAAREQFPPHALVMSFAFSGSLYFYTGFPVLRWDQIEPPVFSRYAAIARSAQRPICAVLFDWEEKDAFRRCPGEWTRLGGVANVGLWQLAAAPPPSKP